MAMSKSAFGTVFLLCLLSDLALSPARPVHAASQAGQGASGYRVSWSTLDAGGGRSLGPVSALRLDGTLGQAEPEAVPLCTVDGGPACDGARFSLRGGFWPALRPVATDTGCEGGDGCLFGDGFEAAASPGALAAPAASR